MKILRNVTVFFFLFVFSALLAVPAFAYSAYSETFLSDPIDGTTRWVAPLKSGASYYYPTITSKWNEQRTTGTSPHVGIDCSIAQTNKVVAVASGTLRMDSTGSSYHTFTIQTNHPTKNVYCHYEHCSSVYASQWYNQGDQVGVGGSYGAPGQPHLHFAAYNTANMSTRKGYRNETLYRNASAWNYGRNCDTFSQMQFNGGTTAQATLVFSGASNTHNEKPSQAQIYYRVHGATAWIGPYAMTNSSGYHYTYNFRNLVSSGTTIDWVVRYRRSSPAAYMWAPAKFYNPSSDPNGSTYKWGYAMATVSD